MIGPMLKQPAIGGHQPKEIRRQPADAGLLEHRGQRLGLLIGAENRAAHEPREFRILIDQRGETVEIGLHRVDAFLLERELEQRGGVAARYSGDDRFPGLP